MKKDEESRGSGSLQLDKREQEICQEHGKEEEEEEEKEEDHPVVEITTEKELSASQKRVLAAIAAQADADDGYLWLAAKAQALQTPPKDCACSWCGKALETCLSEWNKMVDRLHSCTQGSVYVVEEAAETGGGDGSGAKLLLTFRCCHEALLRTR
uniref:Uncharacterized protein n=1 Tax=Chromera velia CCMP2878 TaxID=1169474 RepID=A0A0G4FFJ4_9ALVE|eukprot:Cvel_3278.t1-p1 / transcript=Cvel_3278.t1 / gene=Cvel_3278 / organism=Chromera_velia_CCMP2878 / gene_product=hypothetical protein / transcript_product=hypothetical protein / location=Cvel_scaffold129:10724-11313(-) / protein_length=154 / sequence_SO=supercontig / SO=protein_coding / is_pseudo=false